MVRNALAHLIAQDAAQGLQVWGLEDVVGRAVLARQAGAENLSNPDILAAIQAGQAKRAGQSAT
jgi:hypothetical protein